MSLENVKVKERGKTAVKAVIAEYNKRLEQFSNENPSRSEKLVKWFATKYALETHSLNEAVRRSSFLSEEIDLSDTADGVIDFLEGPAQAGSQLREWVETYQFDPITNLFRSNEPLFKEIISQYNLRLAKT